MGMRLLTCQDKKEKKKEKGLPYGSKVVYCM